VDKKQNLNQENGRGRKRMREGELKKKENG
jgi:hypothetical protein